MRKEPNKSVSDEATRSSAKQRTHCLEHAADLIASAERVLGADSGYANVAYHLAILALEEVGKAGMLAAREISGSRREEGWIDKRLDDHTGKLLWAVWSPSLSGGKISPQDFEDARKFAENTHRRRLAGLYVDHTANSMAAPPKEAVRLEQATSLIGLAKARRELEELSTRSVDASDGRAELEWFLATVNDEVGQKRLFSKRFIDMHEELRGDTRAWVRWAQSAFAEIEAEETALMQQELNRAANEPGCSRPKWRIRVRLKTSSHSLRQKALNYWNERVRSVALSTAGPKNEDLVLEITINDHIKIDEVFEAGLAASKLHIAMLNIGSAGFFWYEMSGQSRQYFESIQDLDAPHMSLSIEKGGGLTTAWSQVLPGGKTAQRQALEEAHLGNAIRCLAAFGPWSDKDAEPVFGPNLQALEFPRFC